MATLNSAHGGPGWQPRAGSLHDDIGTLWAACGVDSEVGTLRHVLLCRPCPAIEAMTDPAAALWDALPDLALLHEQHAACASPTTPRTVQGHRICTSAAIISS